MLLSTFVLDKAARAFSFSLNFFLLKYVKFVARLAEGIVSTFQMRFFFSFSSLSFPFVSLADLSFEQKLVGAQN